MSDEIPPLSVPRQPDAASALQDSDISFAVPPPYQLTRQGSVWSEEWQRSAVNVGVFWDFENVRPKKETARHSCATIRSIVNGIGNMVEGVAFTNMAATATEQVSALREFGFDLEQQLSLHRGSEQVCTFALYMYFLMY